MYAAQAVSIIILDRLDRSTWTHGTIAHSLSIKIMITYVIKSISSIAVMFH